MSKGLEALIEIEMIHCKGCFHFPKEDCPCKVIEKELKALEIITRVMELNVNWAKQLLEMGYLTQEEYDLLDEVLL